MTDEPTPTRPKSAVTLALVLVAVVALGAILFKKASSPSIDDLLAIMPTDVGGFTVIRGLPALAIEFGGVDGGLFDDDFRATVDDDFVEAIEDIEEVLDVDLGKASSLVKLGFDPTSPAAVAMTMIRAKPVIAFYLPASDSETLANTLRKYVEGNGTTVSTDSLGDGDLFYFNEAAWAAHGDVVVMAYSDEEKIARRLIEDTVEGRDVGILEKSWVQSVRPLIDDDWQVLLAADPDLPQEFVRALPRDLRRLLDEDGMQNIVRDLEGFALALDASPKSIRLKTRLTSEEGADLVFDFAAGAKKDTLGSKIPGTALGAGRIAVDIGKVLDTLSEEESLERELKGTMREIRRETGVDVEDDLLEYLGSPVSFAVFDSERASEVPLGFAAWVPVKEDHRLDRTFRDFEDALSKERVDVDTDKVGDVKWHSIQQDGVSVAWGVARDHLVLVFGKRLIEDIAKSLDKPDASYLDKVSPIAESAIVQSGDAAAWIDVDEVLRTLEPMLERDRDFRDALPFLKLVNEVLLTSTSSDRSSALQLEFVSDQGFDKTAKEAVEAERDKNKKRRWRSAGLYTVDGIRTAEKAYHAEWDAFTSAAWTPPTVPKEPVAFAGGGLSNFNMLGWIADGQVPCRFKVEAKPGRSRRSDDFLVTAECDADGDGDVARYEADRRQRARVVTPPDVY